MREVLFGIENKQKSFPYVLLRCCRQQCPGPHRCAMLWPAALLLQGMQSSGYDTVSMSCKPSCGMAGGGCQWCDYHAQHMRFDRSGLEEDRVTTGVGATGKGWQATAMGKGDRGSQQRWELYSALVTYF